MAKYRIVRSPEHYVYWRVERKTLWWWDPVSSVRAETEGEAQVILNEYQNQKTLYPTNA